MRECSPPPHVTCHMSHVTCHMSHVTCHYYYYFLTQWWSLSVEGLLSTGPTLSSFLLPTWQVLNAVSLFIGTFRHVAGSSKSLKKANHPEIPVFYEGGHSNPVRTMLLLFDLDGPCWTCTLHCTLLCTILHCTLLYTTLKCTLLYITVHYCTLHYTVH